MIRTLIGTGIGLSVVSSESPDYFEKWQQEDLSIGTHYWRRDGKICYEYKDYQNYDIVVVYTIKRVGELDEMITRQRAQGREDAIRIITDIRRTI